MSNRPRTCACICARAFSRPCGQEPARNAALLCIHTLACVLALLTSSLTVFGAVLMQGRSAFLLALFCVCESCCKVVVALFRCGGHQI